MADEPLDQRPRRRLFGRRRVEAVEKPPDLPRVTVSESTAPEVALPSENPPATDSRSESPEAAGIIPENAEEREPSAMSVETGLASETTLAVPESSEPDDVVDSETGSAESPAAMSDPALAAEALSGALESEASGPAEDSAASAGPEVELTEAPAALTDVAESDAASGAEIEVVEVPKSSEPEVRADAPDQLAVPEFLTGDAELDAASAAEVEVVEVPEPAAAETVDPDPSPSVEALETSTTAVVPEPSEATAGTPDPETTEATEPTPDAEAPRGEDEEAMVTANPPMPDIAAPDADRAGARSSREVTGLPALDEPGGAPNEAAGVLPLPRVIAIANQKGGVGKTTTAVNLGAALAEAGYRVLVVDLDPQGNASTGLGINHRDVESSVYDVIMSDAPALDCVEPTSLKNLFVLPATIDLAGAEIELVSAFSRELKLRRALDLVRPEYDIILIDCPPSLGLLTVNGLAAADDVIVPVQSEYYALEGLGQLLKNVAMVRSLNPTLDVRGIVLTMHDSRTKLAEQVEHEVREHFGARVYKTVVPRTVRLSEAPSFGQPIIVFDPTSRGATAYRELAKEVSGGATRRTR